VGAQAGPRATRGRERAMSASSANVLRLVTAFAERGGRAIDPRAELARALRDAADALERASNLTAVLGGSDAEMRLVVDHCRLAAEEIDPTGTITKEGA
jgi:hypothetical protein